MPSRPKRDPDLRILSKDLTTIPLSVILANLRKRDVTLYLPKFTIENNLDLIPTLQDVSEIITFKQILAEQIHLTVTVISVGYREYIQV